MDKILIRKNAAIEEGQCAMCETCPLLTVDDSGYEMIWEMCALGFEVHPYIKRYILQDEKDKFKGDVGAINCGLHYIVYTSKSGMRCQEPERVLFVKNK